MPKAKKRKGKKDQAVSAAVLAGLKPTVSSHRSKSKKAKSSDSSSSGSSSDSDDKDKEKEPTPTALGTEEFDSGFPDLGGRQKKPDKSPPDTGAEDKSPPKTQTREGRNKDDDSVPPHVDSLLMDLERLGYFKDDHIIDISFGDFKDEDTTDSSSDSDDEEEDAEDEKPLDFQWENTDGFHFGPTEISVEDFKIATHKYWTGKMSFRHFAKSVSSVAVAFEIRARLTKEGKTLTDVPQIYKFSHLENLLNEDNFNNDKNVRSMQFLDVMKGLEQKISNSGRTLIRDDLMKLSQIYCEANAEGGSSTTNSREQMREVSTLKHTNSLLMAELSTTKAHLSASKEKIKTLNSKLKEKTSDSDKYGVRKRQFNLKPAWGTLKPYKPDEDGTGPTITEFITSFETCLSLMPIQVKLFHLRSHLDTTEVQVIFNAKFPPDAQFDAKDETGSYYEAAKKFLLECYTSTMEDEVVRSKFEDLKQDNSETRVFILKFKRGLKELDRIDEPLPPKTQKRKFMDKLDPTLSKTLRAEEGYEKFDLDKMISRATELDKATDGRRGRNTNHLKTMTKTLDSRERSFHSDADLEESIANRVVATLKSQGNNFGRDKPWDQKRDFQTRPKKKPKSHSKKKSQKSDKNPKWTSESFNDKRYSKGIWQKRESYLKGGGKASGKPAWFKNDGFEDHQTKGWHKACCLCNMVGHSADQHDNFAEGNPQCHLTAQ